MATTIVDGKAVATLVRAEVKKRVEALREQGIIPGLGVVLVGDDPASHVYVRNKGKAAREVGIEAREVRLPASSSTQDVVATVKALADDAGIHGILVQMPLPKQVNVATVLATIPAAKDVDGITLEQAGRLYAGEPGLWPCTPAGVLRLLRHHNVKLEGAAAVVVGRSILVGKPMASILLAQNATVTVCHSRTRDLPAQIGQADVVVAALGRSEFIHGAWIKPGAAVMDVGINRGADGGLKGDVEFSAAVERASVITPVPGGVGPMTIAYLLHNTAEAAAALKEGRPPRTSV